jgi:hypothetical protein
VLRSTTPVVFLFTSTSITFTLPEIWTTLQQRLDTASTTVDGQALYLTFSNLRPEPGAPIGDYFAQLLEIRNQIAGSDEAISDAAFKTHLFKTLPPAFEVTAKI